VVGQDSHGHPRTQGYRLEVDPELAPIVVRIFEGYAHQGLGLRTLAHRLNAEGVAPPRARRAKGRVASWSPTAIREMLRNPIYRGERVWNRSEWIKDHETGKRQRFERPESEWVRQQEEAWRIVPDELWNAAQDVRGGRNARHLRDGKGRIRRSAPGSSARRKRLLAGFLECGECGGAFHVVSRDNWGCSWHRNRGPRACSNDAKIPQAILERAMLHAVREALDEEVAEHALEVALGELRRRIAAAEPRRLEETLTQLDTKISRALDLAIGLGDLAEAKEKLGALRDERSRVAREYEQARTHLPTVEELMPRVRAMLRNVEAMMRSDVALGRLALGGLLGENRVRIYPDGRIEGLATLSPETLAAPEVSPGAARPCGSGGPLHARSVVDLPVRIAS
jgi:hypothetical protein